MKWHNNITILVVDDNSENLKVVNAFIQHEGYKLAFATSGKAAIEIIERNSIDIILLDIMMPEMDGYEVAEYLKKTVYSSVEILFLSAVTEKDELQKAYKAGARDYVVKPIFKEELITRLNNTATLAYMKQLIKNQQISSTSIELNFI